MNKTYKKPKLTGASASLFDMLKGAQLAQIQFNKDYKKNETKTIHDKEKEGFQSEKAHN